MALLKSERQTTRPWEVLFCGLMLLALPGHGLAIAKEFSGRRTLRQVFGL